MTTYKRIVMVAAITAAFGVGSFMGSLHFSEAATSLSDAASISQNNTFTGIQNKFPKGIFIGEQGSGGVTYFNGTIANLTTDTDGNGIPVTVGDDMRVDGQIWRGENTGSGDDMPVKINDDLEVSGDITGGGTILQTAEKPSEDPATITTTQSGDNYDAPEAVYMTTDDSTLLIMFTGTISNNTANQSARVFLIVDGEILSNSVRRGTTGEANDTFTLATQALVDVSAGEHTIQVGFNTDAGTTASLFNRTLDVLEIK